MHTLSVISSQVNKEAKQRHQHKAARTNYWGGMWGTEWTKNEQKQPEFHGCTSLVSTGHFSLNSGTFSFQGLLSSKALSPFNLGYWIFFYPERNLNPHRAGIFVNQKVLEAWRKKKINSFSKNGDLSYNKCESSHWLFLLTGIFFSWLSSFSILVGGQYLPPSIIK